MYQRLDDYHHLLSSFVDAGYQSAFFNPPIPKKQALLLRHDIDFDVTLTREVAAVEESLGLRATYFFLLRSDFYNLFSPTNFEIVNELRDRGHHVSVHFDPCVYGEEILEGLTAEREVFERAFGVAVDCVSVHRPHQRFLGDDQAFGDLKHTYQKCFSKDIKYISDSRGFFRYGEPLESNEYFMRQSIHLLTHPIWWVTDTSLPVAILNNFLGSRTESLAADIGANCQSYAVSLKYQAVAA